MSKGLTIQQIHEILLQEEGIDPSLAVSVNTLKSPQEKVTVEAVIPPTDDEIRAVFGKAPAPSKELIEAAQAVAGSINEAKPSYVVEMENLARAYGIPESIISEATRLTNESMQPKEQSFVAKIEAERNLKSLTDKGFER